VRSYSTIKNGPKRRTWQLPEHAVNAIEKILKPAMPFQLQRGARLIGQLDKSEFKRREAA
jgi:hypothetical protein